LQKYLIKFQHKWSQKLARANAEATTQFNNTEIDFQRLKSGLLSECEQSVREVSVEDLRTRSMSQPFTVAYLQQEAMDQARTKLLRRKKSASFPGIGLKGKNRRDALRLQEAKGRNLLWSIPASHAKHSSAPNATGSCGPLHLVPAPLGSRPIASGPVSQPASAGALASLAEEILESRRATYDDSDSDADSAAGPEPQWYSHFEESEEVRQQPNSVLMPSAAGEKARVQENSQRYLAQIRQQIREHVSSQKPQRSKRPHLDQLERAHDEREDASTVSAKGSKRHRQK
jgi:hypothetical protein